jgi:hypothetical protein
VNDTRTIEKIRKLLALANDKGATEAEAALAAERAQDLMNQHGLEMASLDLTGEGEAREKGAATAVGLGREAWAESLMSAVAESCYVTAWTKRVGRRLEGFTLIGRKSAVVSCEIMFSYLSRTVIRLSRAETGSQRYFRFGCAERIAQRIVARHHDELRKQREAADAQRTQNTASGNGTALVVVLEDYAQKERDMNRDFMRGVAPGTSARERIEAQDKQRRIDARIAELQAQDIGWDEAWWMASYNMTLEQAIEKERTNRESAASDKTRYRDRVDFDARRRNDPSFIRGSRAGADVSLDRQVAADKRRISN